MVVPWSHVLYGSLAGPALGTVLLRLRRAGGSALFATAAGACVGTWVWNTLLNVRDAGVIDVDVPFRPFPISWQDAGTGVFAFAGAALVLLATAHRDLPGRRTLTLAGVTALAVLVVDVYTW